MEPFDLEKARAGRQIVHKDGRKAKDWHCFERRGNNKIAVQWEDNSVIFYADDGKHYMNLSYGGKPVIGLEPERVVEYVSFNLEGFWASRNTLEYAKTCHPNAIAYFKLSCNSDGSDPKIEEVE